MADRNEAPAQDVTMADSDNLPPALDNIHNIPSDPITPAPYLPNSLSDQLGAVFAESQVCRLDKSCLSVTENHLLIRHSEQPSGIPQPPGDGASMTSPQPARSTPNRAVNGTAEVSAPLPAKAAPHGAPVRRYLNEKVTGVLLDGMKRLATDQYVPQRRAVLFETDSIGET